MIYKSSMCLNKTSLCNLYYIVLFTLLCCVGMESELETLKSSMKLTVQNKEEKEHGVQFLNDEHDNLESVSCMRSKTSQLLLVFKIILPMSRISIPTIPGSSCLKVGQPYPRDKSLPSGQLTLSLRADKGWAVKRARPSKKV